MQSVVEPVFRRVFDLHQISAIAGRVWISSRSLDTVHLSDALGDIARLVVQIQPGDRARLVRPSVRSCRSRYSGRLLHKANLVYSSQIEGWRAGRIEVVVSEHSEIVELCSGVGRQGPVDHDAGDSV